MRKTHKISDFSETIQLYSTTLVADGAGGFKPTYTLNATLLASVMPYDGDLFIEGGERVLNNKYQFVVRYNSTSASVNKGYKIVYRGSDYIIHSVIVEDADRYYTRIIAYLRK